ncbi:FHA domain-containing protein [Gilvimarinus xylanilyticus]|uniref:FHA domain-containing protein n=1 Tax=Gilvimarinus xylanilyticus TaxID=2944139 RepID=A0A9X2I198_9GAMM|nr:FHA domain-containing protein [Gilvimarinus xylanilyticus]MCP8898823.1 FHA domain-containing protein [Gilvimarinus xylanilyticus]
MLKIRFKDKKYSAVWLVEPSISIGRDRGNPMVVSSPNIADKHLLIEVEHETLHLVNLVPGSQVEVNGNQVEERCRLKARDIINLLGVQLEIIDPKDESVAEPVVPKRTNPRAPKATGWALKANSSALGNRVFPLKLSNVVGRATECDISLAAAHLSRRHAELSIVEGVLYVKDLGSANGTFLNGQPVTEARVKRGDELRFDTLAFGVIGPADDIAKTTVRTTGRDNSSVRRRSYSPQPRAEEPAVQPQSSPSEADNNRPRYGSAGLSVLVVLTLVVVAALVFTRGG